MKEKKIAVIGVGGRTGTMFAFELGKVSNLLGIGRDIEKIKQEELFVEKKDNSPELFKRKAILDSQWSPEDFLPEIIFLTTKNPIGPVVKYYYQRLRGKKIPLPTLVLSQNGIVAGEDALSALKEILGIESRKIRVIRLNLFNPIDKKEKDDKVWIAYSLPIRVVFGKVSGPGNLKDLKSLFKKAGFEAKEFPSEKVKNMEFSKLFLNLIGMASATRGFSIKEGFKKPEVFREEIGVLKEYIKTVQASGGCFLNFPHCPVKLFASLFNILPMGIFFPFRNYFAKLISRERKGKLKDLTEIEYYTGTVVNLGKKTGTPTPINQKIVARVSK